MPPPRSAVSPTGHPGTPVDAGRSAKPSRCCLAPGRPGPHLSPRHADPEGPLEEVYCHLAFRCVSVVLKLQSQRISHIMFAGVTLFVVVVVGVLVLRGRGAQS